MAAPTRAAAKEVYAWVVINPVNLQESSSTLDIAVDFMEEYADVFEELADG